MADNVSTEPRDIIARKVWRDDNRTGSFDLAEDTDKVQYRRIADEYLAALTAAGYELVKLPTGTADFTGLEWVGTGWDVFAYGGSRGGENPIEVTAVSKRISAASARSFAAALLAAVKVFGGAR